MTENKNKTSLLPSLATGLVDTDERSEQIDLLLNEFLPHLAVEIENSMHAQEARLLYERISEQGRPKIRVVFKLKKLEHPYDILLDSPHALFIIGREVGGETASNAFNACAVLKTLLLKFKVN
jgi:hypothetical protein